MSPQRSFLLTGVTGFLGKVVLEELVRRKEELGVRRVYVPIRPRGDLTGRQRFEQEVAGSPCFGNLEAGWTGLVQVLEADLEQPGLGLGAQAAPKDVTHIIHSAASVSFDLPVAEAARANIVTTLNVLEFAKACPRLERLVAVSTAYVTPAAGKETVGQEELTPLPKPAADLFEDIRAPLSRRAERRVLRSTGHPNTYTLTKAIAEHLLLERRGHVPVTIVRPSIISASLHHPFPGWIDSKAGFAGFVVLLGAGHLRAVVGDGDSRLDLVPVDEVAARLLAACADQEPARLRHAAAGASRSATVRECWQGIQRFYGVHRVHRTPKLHYLGPRDVRFRMAEALHHGVPTALAALPGAKARRRSRTLRGHLRHVNRAFPYFTSHSFDFRSSRPLDASFDPHAYVELVCRGVHRHVLRADHTQSVLAGARHPGHGGDLLWALRQPGGNLWVRMASWAVTKVLRRTLDRVTVDLASFERARRAAPPETPLVLVATHRSYLDFVLVSYLAFARPELGLPIPHVAATIEFGKVPVLGRVLSSLHAFYLRRGLGKEDPDLTRRVNGLIAQGRALEFFIEGTRSRTREFLPPKRGLLRAIQATGRPVTILPIALSYDRVPEERTFALELSGEPKPKMRLGALLRWTRAALRGDVQLGRAHIACGAPLHLGPDDDVHEVGQATMARLRDATVSTTFHLRAFLRHFPQPGMDEDRLRQAIEANGGRVLDSPLEVPDDLDPQVAWSFRHQFEHHLRDPPQLVAVDLHDVRRGEAIEVPVHAPKGT